MKRYVVFRLDANSLIGIGHLMRCLTLAKKLKEYGFSIAFICRISSQSCIPWVKGILGEVYFLSSLCERNESNWLVKDSEETLAILNTLDVYLLVVDHYDLTDVWESLMMRQGLRVMALDDLAERKHYVSFLLDSSLNRSGNDYKELVNSDAICITGEKFVLLRSEFLDLRPQAIDKRNKTKEIKRVLINFGGTDPKRQIFSALEALSTLEIDYIDILISSSCPWITELNDLKLSNIIITIFIDSKNVAELMLQADLAVGSLGISSWERCCLGLPTIALISADNQKYNARSLEKIGAIILSDQNRLASDLLSIIDNKNGLKLWNNLKNKGISLVDGMGVNRICYHLLSQDFSLESMAEKDINTLYAWQIEPSARKYSRVKEIPSYQEHINWFLKSITNPSRKMWVVLVAGLPAGYVRLDDDGTQEEISILISSKFRSIGLAKFSITQALKNRKYSAVLAYVEKDNKDSVKLFSGCGFKMKKENHYVWSEGAD